MQKLSDRLNEALAVIQTEGMPTSDLVRLMLEAHAVAIEHENHQCLDKVSRGDNVYIVEYSYVVGSPPMVLKKLLVFKKKDSAQRYLDGFIAKGWDGIYIREAQPMWGDQ